MYSVEVSPDLISAVTDGILVQAGTTSNQ